MSTAIIEVAAPSRLHFGMFSFAQSAERQFGGVGAMISKPGLRLRISPAAAFTAVGPLSARAGEYALRVARAWGDAAAPACRLEVLKAPPEHVGLGTGTQLGLAVAAGLCALRGLPTTDPAQLARLVGRGERSAIGTYGFARGGLLIEAGKLAQDELSPLVARYELPAEWRFVLLEPLGLQGLSGEAERRAFAALPPVATGVTADLCRLALLGLAPAAATANFEAFSEALYDFGYLAGSCFAAHQGRPFATAGLAELVAAVRSLGVRGVGQSSWGPTLFALFASKSEAQHFCIRFRQTAAASDLDLLLAAPNNAGAQIVPSCR